MAESSTAKIAYLQGALGDLSVGGESLPFECAYAVDNAYRLPEIEIGGYPGLLQVHLAQQPDDPGVLTCYWKSESHFRAVGERFRNDANLPRAALAGTLNTIRRERKKWWETFSLREIVLGIAAVLGAFAVIRDNFAGIFAQPAVAVVSSDMGLLDVTENSQVTIPMTATNQDRLVPISLRLDRAELKNAADPKSIQKLDWDVPGLPVILPGQHAEFKLFGIAPPLPANRTGPVTLDPDVAVSAEGGYLWGWRPFAGRARQVRVWPMEKIVARPVVKRADHNYCQAEGVLYAGKPYPNGLLAEIVASGPPGFLSGMDAAAPGMSQEQKDHPDDQTFKVEFRTAPLDKFQPYKYQIMLSGPAGFDRGKCEKLMSDPRLDISFR